MKAVAIILIAGALGAAAAQQQPDESNLPERERRIPPGHYCKRADVPITKNETRAHPCGCTYSCTVDPGTGIVTERESDDCMAFCKRNARRCTCHVEEPCATPGHGNAWMDMDGRVVAVLKPPQRSR